MNDHRSRRIVSFLPSATEMAFELGLGECLMGVTHECDYPPGAKKKPVVVRSVLPDGLTQREIDNRVSERLKRGLSLYEADEEMLLRIAPDLILTQELCAVCAPSGNEIAQLFRVLPKKPEVLWLTPKSLGGIFENLRQVGKATGRLAEAESRIANWRKRLEAISTATRDCAQTRVFCMEWIDPPYCSGHWVPEMVRYAGGVDVLGREGRDSVRIAWEEVLRWAPEVLVIMPCGLDLEKSAAAAEDLLPKFAEWTGLPAVRSGRVYAVDANAYFARPGPRVVDGVELLAHLIHPARMSWRGPTAYRKVACPA
jgi:iron complex transport system substrate-binding protein